MENSGNESNKKAIMKVLCAESHSEQINIYVTSGRFSGGTDAMVFNYNTDISVLVPFSTPNAGYNELL